MLNRIEYVYDKDKNERKQLLGAKVYQFDGSKTKVQEIYVGIKFVLEDLKNNINMSLFEGTTYDRIKMKYDSVSAAGIIYFPQTENYAFLEDNDEVINWNGHDRTAGLLDKALEPYKELASDELLKAKIAKRKAYIETLDPDDPLVELSDYTLSRTPSSR